jgi:lipid A 3-O-deacylase
MKNLRGYAAAVIFFLILGLDVNGQDSKPTYMIRVYEDNDFFNIRGKGTDNSYTNGTRLDFFYTKQRPSHFIDRLMPIAGDSSVNIFGWGFMQVMVTPNNISTEFYQPNDYQYAGALYITHTLYSYNEKKKYDLQTELIAGIRGPHAFGRQVQSAIHRWIGYQKPLGWNNQLRTSPLVNINFTAEKQLLRFGSFIEVIGGAQTSAGTFLDAITVYPLVRIGKMSPYFTGLFNQHGSYTSNGKRHNAQLYFVIRPQASAVLHNALFKGNNYYEVTTTKNFYEQPADISHYHSSLEFGAVIAHGNFSMAYTETHSRAYNEGLYHHSVGNLTVTVRW